MALPPLPIPKAGIKIRRFWGVIGIERGEES
ncbi:MAG: hypothetical protein RLZZ597_2938 [Cyanobacteriota bacterium]|jgi:hypothetical protein